MLLQELYISHYTCVSHPQLPKSLVDLSSPQLDDQQFEGTFSILFYIYPHPTEHGT